LGTLAAIGPPARRKGKPTDGVSRTDGKRGPIAHGSPFVR